MLHSDSPVDAKAVCPDYTGVVPGLERGREPHARRSGSGRAGLPAPGEAASQDAARRFESLVERLLEAAPQEHAMRRLGAALASTMRLVNTLEQSVAPRLDADLAAIRRALDEREREEHVRTRRLIARRRHA
jgi:vacuolar-type H+-ATPase subunit D/Vma8